jgi:hypothetical protein
MTSLYSSRSTFSAALSAATFSSTYAFFSVAAARVSFAEATAAFFGSTDTNTS